MKSNCKRCGACCQLDITFIEEPTKDQIEVMNLKGIRVYMQPEIGWFKVVIAPCQHLSYEGDVAKCGIYNDRPEFCKRYPQDGDVIISDCGYQGNA